MMKAIIQAVILGSFVIVAAVDVVLYCYGGTPATISAWIWATSAKFPILPFFAGVLMGHLFWQVPRGTSKRGF